MSKKTIDSSNETKQLALLGCGPGGYATASYAVRNGFHVTVFEKGELGGVCLNCGCIPTKVYANPTDEPFAEVYAKKNQAVAQLREGVKTLMSQPGITLVHGEARIKDPHTVVCNDTDYPADNIIIATGSRPAMPPIEGIDSPLVVDSTALLAKDTLPPKLVIVGAGVIGMEMASAFNRFGCDVTVIEYMKECLPQMDADLAKRLRKIMQKQGVHFFLGAEVKRIGAETVAFEQKGKVMSVYADTLLIATGRKPNIEDLGLEDAGIETNRRGIQTDPNMMTSVPGIYAIGDVNGRALLAHAAEMQGRQVIDHLMGKNDATCGKLGGYRPDLMPAAVFTNPELAAVGPTEAVLKTLGAVFEVHKSFYRANGKAVATGNTDGLVKLITVGDKIIACHVLGAHAADIVQEATVLIYNRNTIDDLHHITHIHPTLSEVLADCQ